MAPATESRFQELLQQAQTGHPSALGQLLEAHRPWLKVLAFRFMQGGIAARVDESDLVQQTCLSVHKNFEQFQGQSPAEFVAWLKKIHEGNLQNAIREHVHAQKRAVDREHNHATETLAASTSSPSQRLLAGEQAVQLAAGLEKLVSDQREAIQLRYLEGFTLSEISEKMNRSQSSVVGLIQRGLKALRKQLHWD